MSNKKNLTTDTIYDTIKKRKGSGKLAAVEKIIEKMKRQPNGIRPEEAINITLIKNRAYQNGEKPLLIRPVSSWP